MCEGVALGRSDGVVDMTCQACVLHEEKAVGGQVRCSISVAHWDSRVGSSRGAMGVVEVQP